MRFVSVINVGILISKHKEICIWEGIYQIAIKIFQTSQRWVDTIKQIAKPELQIYFSF